MKQIAQNIKNGEISVENVPIPQLRKGCVLVQNMNSLISSGTEGGTVRLGKMNYFGKIRERPQEFRKVLKALKTEGIISTLEVVKRSIDIPIPMGYSSSGIIRRVSEGITDLCEGDAVACMGSGVAYHAEYIAVPRNLCVKIPNNLSFQHAAFGGIGSIAMQSIRIADIRFGENVIVIGLGLIGLLIVEILKSAGINVLGIDNNANKIEYCKLKNICQAISINSDYLQEKNHEFSDGYGADAIIVTASGKNNETMDIAGELCRHKGKVVVIGRMLIQAPRETYLFKELEIRTSYAYGPGVDDPIYEKEGYDYPIKYVRWTENRNLKYFIDLVCNHRINIDPLVTHIFHIDNAKEAYNIITDKNKLFIGIIFKYEDQKDVKDSEELKKNISKIDRKGRIIVGIIGAGSFATNIMIPILSNNKNIKIKSIVSANGFSAAMLGKKYKIEYRLSNADDIFSDKEIDCVFILTRHSSHADYTIKALLADKHVFVEKPIALTTYDLNEIEKIQNQKSKTIMIGFNRRYSIYWKKIKKYYDNRNQPMIIDYRGNVGYRPPNHWLHEKKEGGLILGEACHYIDTCRWITASNIKEIYCRSIGISNSKIIKEDNFQINLGFDDGSIANILYSSNGSIKLGRERCEIHSMGKSIIWEDFKFVRFINKNKSKNYQKWIFFDKGYKSEINDFLNAINDEDLRNQIFQSQMNSSRAAILANDNLNKGTITL